jgi:penicillin amidase
VSRLVAWRGVIKVRLAAVGGAVALAVTGVVPGALGAAAAGTAPATQGFVIQRSSYGVPTITATSQARMWFGAGWAQAQDRMVQLELTRRAVEGTLSAIFGPGELSQDETARTFFYTPAELTAQFQSLPAAARTAITEFSDGINAYEASAYTSATSEQQKVPYEFFVLGQALGLTGPYQPAPWQPEDTVAVGNFLARQFGGGGGSEATNLQFLQYLENELIKTGAKHPFTTAAAIFNDSRWINDPTAPTTVPGPGLHAPAGAAPARADGSLLRAAARLPAISRAGSVGRPDDYPPERRHHAGAVPRRFQRHRGVRFALGQRPRAAVGRAAGGVRHPERGR